MNAPVRAISVVYRFGRYELDEAATELTRQGRRVSLPPQPLRLLHLLVSRSGRLVTRAEIIQTLWGDGTIVEYDQAIHTLIRQLRQSLGDRAASPTFIETVPKRGYRFLASVSPVAPLTVPHAAQHTEESAPLPPFPAAPPRRAWAGAIGATLAVAFLLAGSQLLPRRPDAASGSNPTLLVRPLSLQDASENDDHVAFGLTEDLVERLARLPIAGLTVLAPETSRRLATFAGQGSRSIEPDYVLEGTLFRVGTGLELDARLLRTSDGISIWRDRIRRSDGDLPALQRALVDRTAGSLAVALGSDRTAPRNAGGQSLGQDEFDGYLQARYLLHRGDASSVQRAAAILDNARGDDRRYAPLRALHSSALGRLAFSQHPVPENLAEIVAREADEAVRLDPRLPEAHLARAYASLYLDWDHDAAGASLARALALAPGSAEVHRLHSSYLAATGRAAEALEHARIALRLDPLNLAVNGDLCWYHLYADAFEDAVAECKRALELDPGHGWSMLGLAEAQRRAGDRVGATETLLRGFNVDDATAAKLRAEPDPLQAMWHRMATGYLAPREPEQVDAFLAAVMHTCAGDEAAALDWLQQAVKQRNGWLVFVEVDPRLDELHDRADYAEVVRAVSLSRFRSARAPKP